MKATLFIIAGSCFLFSCKSINKAVAYIDKISTPPAASAAPAAQSTGYAPANVGDREITIKKPNADIPELSPYFISDNTTGSMSSAMAKYAKTGNNTAQIEHWDRYGEFTLYKLQFTSPRGGKVVGKNMIFTIK